MEYRLIYSNNDGYNTVYIGFTREYRPSTFSYNDLLKEILQREHAIKCTNGDLALDVIKRHGLKLNDCFYTNYNGEQAYKASITA